MQIAVVGLGKMGYNLSLNLHRNFFEVFAYDINEETRRTYSATMASLLRIHSRKCLMQ